jgi:hypothetical protein
MTWESISQGFQEEIGIEKFSNLKRLSVHDSLHHQHGVMSTIPERTKAHICCVHTEVI